MAAATLGAPEGNGGGETAEAGRNTRSAPRGPRGASRRSTPSTSTNVCNELFWGASGLVDQPGPGRRAVAAQPVLHALPRHPNSAATVPAVSPDCTANTAR